MTPERWPEVKRLLDESAELAPEALPAWLDEACSGDQELRHEVESLLAYEEDLDLFAEFPVHGLLEIEDDGGTDVGRRFGPYRVRELLGRGGMGAVYVAEREAGFEQRVALKVVPPGTESPHVLRRFYRERQILARLKHPNIAHLLDGGTSEDGRPFFALELVEGIPIDQYCTARRLGVRERVLLFLQVCEAIRFAHRNLVVHRDLKPDNVLVTDDGTVKLLDFGIAKLQRPELEEATDAGIPMPMTLRYASPEQLRGEPISTASDVYSVGVVLYQLLTGSLPCGVESRGRAEATKAVCEEPPLLPSEQAAETKELLFQEGRERRTPRSVAFERDTTPLKLRRQLHGDLDAIVLETLHKEASKRYSSVDRLIADLHRYLDDLPVRARRGTLAYTAKKYVRRHRWVLASVAAVLVLILSFTVALARQLGQTERERERAEALSSFLVDLFRAAEPDRAGEEPSVRELVDEGRRRLATDLVEEPEVRAKLLLTLGEVYGRLGHYDAARESLEAARQLHAGDDDTARVLNDLGTVAYERGELEPAEELYRQSIAIRERLGLVHKLIKPRNGLAAVFMARGRLDEAEALYRQGLEQRRALTGDRHRNVATSLRNLATVLYLRGELDAAQPLLEEALSIRAEAFGRDSPAAATVLASLAQVHHARGEDELAEKLYTEALDVRRRRLGGDHLHVATLERNLAALYVELGQLDAAGELLEHALDVLYRLKSEDDWMRADAESVYGAYLLAHGRPAEAEPYLRSAYETLERVRGPDVLYTRQALRRLEALTKN